MFCVCVAEIPGSEKQALEEYRPRLLEEVEINSVLRGLLRKQIFTKTLNFEVRFVFLVGYIMANDNVPKKNEFCIASFEDISTKSIPLYPPSFPPSSKPVFTYAVPIKAELRCLPMLLLFK